MDLLFEANRLASELGNQLRKTLLVEAEKKPLGEKRTLVAYSGNFQPFHAGHYKIYRTLVKKFDKDNVYITTTNQQEDVENPMSFEDKKKLATQMFPIEDSKFQEIKNPFVPIELLKKFDPRTTSLVTVISTDDADVVSKSEYFHKYVEGQALKAYAEAAYYLTVPELTMQVGNQHLTNPQIMQILGSPKTSDGVKTKMFNSLYGADNKDMLGLISKRAGPGAAELDGVGKTDATGQKNVSKPGKTDATGQDNETDDDKDDDNTPPIERMIVNPLTGREIKVKSALKYPRWKPVYKKAEKMMRDAGVDRKNRVDEPEVNARYKAREKRLSKEELSAYLGQVLSEQLGDHVTRGGATLIVPGFGEVQLKVNESFLHGLKTESDTPTPVAIFGGRFQPFHAGHYSVYQNLVNKFGKDNVYIASSNKTDGERSPFDFKDKEIIINRLFGVDPSHIVKTDSPYRAPEITSKLAPGTPVVWGVSAKDAQRLEHSKYFKPYDPDTSKSGFEDNGYVYIAPEFSMNVNGKNISGTAIRDVFAKGSPASQKALFKRLYGKDDPQMIDLIANRVKNGPAHPAPVNQTKATKTAAPKPDTKKSSKMRSRLKDKIKNPETDNDIQVATALKYDKAHPAHKAARKYLQGKTAITEGLLFEGGAYGHLLHPYEDLDLTFADLLELASRALGANLDKDGPVVEKIDGQNIMFTVRDGEVKFARSIRQIRNRGESALSAKELRDKFAGRGAIEHSFGDAADDLQTAISKMPPAKVKEIFGDGRKFMNTEIVHSSSENTIPYGKNLLIFHFTVKYTDEGKSIGQYPEDSVMMADELRKVQAEQQPTYKLQGQQFIVLSDGDVDDLEKKVKQYNKELNTFQSKHGLTDKSTIRDYKVKMWNDQFNRSNVKLTPEDRQILMGRWVDDTKATRLTALSSPEVRRWASKMESGNHVQSQNNKIIYPIQSFIARLGMDALNRATGLLSAQNPKAGEKIKDKLAKALKIIRDSGDQDKISQIDRFMKLVDDIGLERILPSEGLVFNFGKKLYKFTGAFAPINRVIGTVKYDDAERAASKSTPSVDTAKVRSAPPEDVPSSTPSMDPTQKIRNPETDRDILVKTALKYDKNHPARKAAEKLVHKESVVMTEDIVQEMAALHEYWHGTH